MPPLDCGTRQVFQALPSALVLSLILVAPPAHADVLKTIPAEGETVSSVPFIAGLHFEDDEWLALTVILNGRDLGFLFAPPGQRRGTTLRPARRCGEAYAEIGLEHGLIEGSNLLTFRLTGAGNVLIDERSVAFDMAPPGVQINYTVVERALTDEAPSGGFSTAPPARLPARVHVFGLDDTPDANFSPAKPRRFMPRDPQRNFVNSPTGRGTLALPAGRYLLMASRGLRYELDAVVVGPGEHDVLFALDHAVPTPGEVAADLHVHTIHSGDSSAPVRMRLASFLATDVDAIVAADHEHVADLSAHLQAWPGADRRLKPIAGAEISIQGTGHWNLWPLEPGDVEALHLGAVRSFWEERTACFMDTAGGLLRRPLPPDAPPGARTEGLIQLNHPLGIMQVPVGAAREEYGDGPLLNTRISYLANIDYRWTAPVPSEFAPDRRVPNDELRRTCSVDTYGVEPRDPLGFDLVEIWNRNDLHLYRAMRDVWFSWLDQGIRRFGVANTDTHTLALVRAGMPRNMVMVGEAHDSAATLTTTVLDRALAAGRSYGTTGPLLQVEARLPGGHDDGPRAGLGQTLETADGRVHLDVTVRAAGWVPVDELRIFVNGDLRRRVTLRSMRRGRDHLPAERRSYPVRRLAHTFPLYLSDGGWIVVEAGVSDRVDAARPPAVDGLYGLIAPGLQPLAFTNPIFVEVADAGTRRRGGALPDAVRRSHPTEARARPE